MMGHAFTNYVLDATTADEDIRFSSLWLTLANTGCVPSDITCMQLWDGSVPLNTGPNVVIPANMSPTGQSYVFTLDQPFVVPKGTKKVLTLRGNISPSAVLGSIFSWGIHEADMNFTGVTSSNDVPETVIASAGTPHTVGSPSPENRMMPEAIAQISWRVRMLEEENEVLRNLIRKATTPSPRMEGELDVEQLYTRIMNRRASVEAMVLSYSRSADQEPTDALVGMEYIRFKRLSSEADEAMNRFRNSPKG